MATVKKTFAFDSDHDAELLEWLATHSNASAIVRVALWEYFRPGITLADVYAKLEVLEVSLAESITLAGAVTGAPIGGEDPVLADALDNLGL